MKSENDDVRNVEWELRHGRQARQKAEGREWHAEMEWEPFHC
jgi:hypothetical protein